MNKLTDVLSASVLSDKLSKSNEDLRVVGQGTRRLGRTICDLDPDLAGDAVAAVLLAALADKQDDQLATLADVIARHVVASIDLFMSPARAPDSTEPLARDL